MAESILKNCDANGLEITINHFSKYSLYMIQR